MIDHIFKYSVKTYCVGLLVKNGTCQNNRIQIFKSNLLYKWLIFDVKK